MALFELLALVPIRKVLTALPCRLNDVKKQTIFFYSGITVKNSNTTVVFLPRSPNVLLLSYSEV